MRAPPRALGAMPGGGDARSRGVASGRGQGAGMQVGETRGSYDGNRWERWGRLERARRAKGGTVRKVRTTELTGSGGRWRDPGRTCRV